MWRNQVSVKDCFSLENQDIKLAKILILKGVKAHKYKNLCIQIKFLVHQINSFIKF